MSFPLLKLPLLAIRIVVDCWNPFEIFNFSLNSTKCKRIATAFCKKAKSITLENWKELGCTVVFYTHIRQWKFVLTSGNPEPYEDTYLSRKCAYQMKNPYTEVLHFMKILMEIFKVTSVRFDLRDDEQFTMYEKQVIFCGLNEFHVEYCEFHYNCPESIQVFFENYRARTDEIVLGTECTFELPKLQKIDFIEHSHLACTVPHNFILSNYIDSPRMEISCEESVKICEHVNTFLKDWISGEKHLRLKTAKFWLMNTMILSEVIAGISRIETRVIGKYKQVDEFIYWIQEEADIHGPNGKTATVQTVRLVYIIDEEADDSFDTEYFNLTRPEGEDCRQLHVIVH